MQSLRLISIQTLLLLLFSYNIYAESKDHTIEGSAGSRLSAVSFGEFIEPWAMTFLPSGELLVSEKKGRLLLVDIDEGSKVSIKGVPTVAYGGQGGLGDIILDPQYKDNNWIYLSYIERDSSGNKGAVVARARFQPSTASSELENLKNHLATNPQSFR